MEMVATLLKVITPSSSLLVRKFRSSTRLAILMAFLAATSPIPAPVCWAQHSSGAFHGCPEEGRKGDLDLNRLKNRDLPPESYRDLTISEIRKKKPHEALVMGKKKRINWSPEARGAVAGWEDQGVRVTGRLIAIRTQKAEACNCGSNKYVDMHLWISYKAASSEKPRSLVVEVSPRLLDQHPNWTSSQFVALAKKGTRVRVSGWLMWDHEHGSEVGNSRGTNWEIHPIHQIEVYSDGEWETLD
jgi:hypothetical protein